MDFRPPTDKGGRRIATDNYMQRVLEVLQLSYESAANNAPDKVALWEDELTELNRFNPENFGWVLLWAKNELALFDLEEREDKEKEEKKKQHKAESTA